MKKKLKVETPYGVFTRTTARDYKFVSVWKRHVTRYIKSEDPKVAGHFERTGEHSYYESWHHTYQLAYTHKNYGEKMGIYEVPEL